MYRFTAMMMTFALALAFQSVYAASQDNVPSAVVKFGDLDASTSKGAAALYRRIEQAAENVCTRMYISEVAYQWAKHSCLPKVIGEAVIKVDRPALSAVFASYHGVSPPVLEAAARTR